ncbi:MAG: hypothetical protein RLZZ290_1810 [Pseudomonadota bacterium]
MTFARVLSPAESPLARPLWQLLLGLLWSAAITLLATELDSWVSLEGALILYLMGTALAGYATGVFASLASSLGSVAGLNYFFIPPKHTLLVDTPQSWIALLGLLLVSLIVSALTLRLQVERTKAESERQQSTLARELLELVIGMDSREDMIEAGRSRISSILESEVLSVTVKTGDPIPDTVDPEIFSWCVRHRRIAGPRTDQGSQLRYWCVPIECEPDTSSILRVAVNQSAWAENDDEISKRLALLRMLGQQMSLALQRHHAALGQQTALVEKAQEEQRNVVLASIAHDLRTPLATILAGVTSLRASEGDHPAPDRLSILHSLETETRRAASMADNVVTWVKLNGLGSVAIHANWQSLEEIVEETGRRTRRLRDENRGILNVYTATGLPLVWGDAELLSKMLENLIENAFRHSARTETITEIRIAPSQKGILCIVMDDGAGFREVNNPPTGHSSPRDEHGPKKGMGLGLSIVRSIVQAHHGTIDFGTRPDGQTGACISIWLPTSPQVQLS